MSLKETHVIACDGPQNGTYLPLNEFIQEDFEEKRYPLTRNMDMNYYALTTWPHGEQVAVWVGDEQ